MGEHLSFREFHAKVEALVNCIAEKYWYLEATSGSRNLLAARFYFMTMKAKFLTFHDYKGIAVGSVTFGEGGLIKVAVFTT